jgi:hypothetical protein
VPPDSPPWFSLAVLAPAYAVVREPIGAGVLGVLVWSLVGVLAVYGIGARIAGPWCGAFGALALLAFSSYPYLSGLLLTDAPAAAVAFIALWLYVGIGERVPWRTALAAGVAIAIASSFRSVYLALLTPFVLRVLRTNQRKSGALALILGPSVAVVVATAIYHQLAFGDWRRTGFQVWMSVPYDYAELVLSPAYVTTNASHFARTDGVVGLVAGAVGAALLAWRGGPRARSMLLAFALAAVPITFFFLAYFYADLRLHLFLLAMGCALGGMALACVLPQRLRRMEIVLVVLVAVAGFALRKPPAPPRDRLDVAEWIARRTPVDAVIISGIEPVYLQAVEPSTSRRTYVAGSRHVEFASKLLTFERVADPEPPPRNAFDHRAEGVKRGGAREAIAFTADERPELVARWVREGKPVYFDRLFLADPLTIERILRGQLTLNVEHADDLLARVVHAR